MKKILLIISALVLVTNAAIAQFAPGQVLGAAQLNAALAAPTITGGSINGSVIGALSPRSIAGTDGTFTSLIVSGPASFAGSLSYTGAVSITGNFAVGVSPTFSVTASNGNVLALGTLSAGGATTLGSTLSVGGAVTVGGAVNKITLTAPATAATLTIANNKTFAVNNTITLSGTDNTTMTFPSLSATIGTTLKPAIATTSGTSAVFLSIPSWANVINVMLDGFSTNGTSNIQLQLGASGGMESSGYISNVYLAGGASSGLVTSSCTMGSGAAANNFSGAYRLSRLTGNTWAGNFIIGGSANPNMGACSKTLAGVLDRLQITTVSTDTFDAGQISISYQP